MEAATVTAKGQVTIPVCLRKRHKIRQGTRICFIERGRDLIIVPVTDTHIDSLCGLLTTKGRLLRDLRAEKKRERER